MRDLHELSANELISLISDYDYYIQYANEHDFYQGGWRPVCINEFINNEFVIMHNDVDTANKILSNQL